jgi:hypothetical protein
MPNQLKLAGSQSAKAMKFVPIYTSRFFQGLWTQRSPLRSGSSGWQTEHFYGVNNDCLIDGLNTELTPKLTLARRPGTSLYNVMDFPPILSFYSFRLFDTKNEEIKVIADTATTIYDATGPDTKTIIYTKSDAGGPARFQSVGNNLYFGDGDVCKKWVQSLLEWTPSTSYNIGDYFVDANGNLQYFSQIVTLSKAQSLNIASTSYDGSTTATVRVYSQGQPLIPVGSTVALSGLVGRSSLNGAGGPVTASTFVTPWTQTFTEIGSQLVLNNVLYITISFAALPPAAAFPIGANISFTGIVDSPYGGGGTITSVTLSKPVGTPGNLTVTVPYAHADYQEILASVSNIVVEAGDMKLTITVGAIGTSASWTDIYDIGTLSMGIGGSSLSNIASIQISQGPSQGYGPPSQILTLTAGIGGFTGTPFNPGAAVQFSGFTGSNVFLNTTTGQVVSNTPTVLTCVYAHTDVPLTLEAGAALVLLAPTAAPTIAVASVTINQGILTCVCTIPPFAAGSSVIINGCATVTALNGLQLNILTTDGINTFTAAVPLPNVVTTPEPAATIQETVGYITIASGKITVTQPNSYQVGQTVMFYGLTNAPFLNNQAFTVTAASSGQFGGDYPSGTAAITHIKVDTNIATITANNSYQVGQTVTLMTTMGSFPSAFPTVAVITAVDPVLQTFAIAAPGFNNKDVDTTGCYAYLSFTSSTDSGYTGTVVGSYGSALSDIASPNFDNLSGASVTDRNIRWVNRGSSVQNMGIAGPSTAPSVGQANYSSAVPIVSYGAWLASTYYGAATTVSITDNNTTPGPYIQELTTPGITGTPEPTWNPVLGGTTSETAPGTAVWTNKGVIGRVQKGTYQVGDRIAVVNYYLQVITGWTQPPPNLILHVIHTPGGDQNTYIPDLAHLPAKVPTYGTTGPFSNYFTCSVAGITADVSASSIVWDPKADQTVTDGTVTWTNSGSYNSSWPGAGVNLSQAGVTVIEDVNGNIQTVSKAGVSGSTVPTWKTNQGDSTTDGGVIWINGGPVSGSSSSAVTPGSWYYGYAYKNSITGEISNMSPESSPIVPTPGIIVSVSGAGPQDPQADTIEIYRTLQGGSTLFKLADISTLAVRNAAWTYTDISPDPPSANSTINLFLTAAVSLENTPPANGTTNWAFYLNRLWGSVGNVLVFSNPPGSGIGASYTQFPPLNYFTFPSKITRMWPMGTSGLLVFTVSDLYIITGTTTAAFSPFPFLKGVGLLNYNAMAVCGSIVYLFTGDGQLLSLDPNSGVTEVGFPVGDQLNTSGMLSCALPGLFSPSTSYVNWHSSGSRDKAIFIADGKQGWFRMSPTASPESGLTWSPYASIVGGTSAVQSIETSPGVVKLLIGS